jgi:methyl-accepting chemotaxis protein WspA
MRDVSVVAEQTASTAAGGQQQLEQMERTMRAIMDASATVSAKLAVLSEKATSIGSVITTITKVADQTNLLSLNAAIEAEKAGEFGHGFSVVAREIRRLADQTAHATLDIERTVKEMQSAVSAGVMGMERFTDEVKQGAKEVTSISGQLGDIIMQVQSLTPRFESVYEGMEAQATGAQQISEGLSQLSEAIKQTASSIRQSTTSVQLLQDASEQLVQNVASFKLERKDAVHSL